VVNSLFVIALVAAMEVEPYKLPTILCRGVYTDLPLPDEKACKDHQEYEKYIEGLYNE
jgi:hypothetical protein